MERHSTATPPATALEAKLDNLRINTPDPPPSVPATVTITELLLTPPFSPPAETETTKFTLAPPPGAFDREFHLFPHLPAELRLKIWSLSFLPRTVELHTRRTHYADFDRHGGTPRWQSQSRNPAALSVNAEARAAALEVYTVALPLAAPLGRNQTFERPGDSPGISDRLLYINPAEDTVVLLEEMQFARLTTLLEWFRKQDAAVYQGRGVGGRGGRGKGLRRLAMSAAGWTHESGALTLKAFARTLFADVEEFVLFMYTDRAPPEAWTGGRVLLKDASTEEDVYRRFVIGRGKQFRQGDGWMVVGKRPLKIVHLEFVDDW